MMMHQSTSTLLTIAVSTALGIWLALPSSNIDDIYFAELPSIPAEISLSENLFADAPRYIESVRKLQRVSERDGETETVSTRFYCPNESLVWGELIVRWEWEADWSPSLGILDPNLGISPEYDAATEAELYVESKSTAGRWILISKLNKKLDRTEIQRSIDVTRWVRNGNYLRVKYRLKAEKFMTHPTPDDPIGFAGAQCLRQLRIKPMATRLQLWK